MNELRTGDTLRVTDPNGSYDSHLWIVVSRPETDNDNVLIVNLTSWRCDKDQACVLDVGDHPYIRKKTCVNYPDSKIVSSQQLDALIQSGHLEKHDPVTMELLERIRQGAMLSRFMPLDHAQILIDQGLVVSGDF
jgi:hypothetical protein